MSYLYSTDYTDCTDVVESNNIIVIKKAYLFPSSYMNLSDGPVVATKVVLVAVMGSNPCNALILFFLFFFHKKGRMLICLP